MPDTKLRSVKATAILKRDHQTVRHLFAHYENLAQYADAETKRGLFEEIKKELTIHATIEEEIFYPAIESLKSEDEEAGDIVSEAQMDHKIVKTLLEELTDLDPEDEQYDAKFKILAGNVTHHAEEEEKEMFPFFDNLDQDRQDEVSSDLSERKSELTKSYEDED